jgi:hypothetical protein
MKGELMKKLFAVQLCLLLSLLPLCLGCQSRNAKADEGGPGKPALASFDMSIEGYPDGTDPEDYFEENQPIKNWVLWCDGVIVPGGARSGGNSVKLPAGRSDPWNTIMKRVEPFIKVNGSGYYRWGCWAKVDSSANKHFGNLGYDEKSTGGWPVFETFNSWKVTVGTSWTQIRTDQAGVYIDAGTIQPDGFNGGNGSKLVYMSFLTTDWGKSPQNYKGAVHLCDFYFEYLGK